MDELLGRWLHSREEDEGDVRVYRPAGYDLPPARGRRGLEFRPDGELLVIGPGPADKPEAAAGRWEPAGEHRARVSLPRATRASWRSSRPSPTGWPPLAARGATPGSDGG